MRVCFIKCKLFETTADVSDNSYISLILKFYVWKSWNITSYHKCFMNHFWGLDLDEHQWRERELWADQKTSGTALVYDERQAVSTLSPVSALCNFEACAFFFSVQHANITEWGWLLSNCTGGLPSKQMFPLTKNTHLWNSDLRRGYCWRDRAVLTEVWRRYKERGGKLDRVQTQTRSR